MPTSVAAGWLACTARRWLQRGKCHPKEELPALMGNVHVVKEGCSALVCGAWEDRVCCGQMGAATVASPGS